MKVEQKVVIYDVSNGNWEINELTLSLCHKYTPGLSTILPIKYNKKITITKWMNQKDISIMLTAPSWYRYIIFGFKMLFWKIGRRNES